ncbi:DUF5806 family protein [Halobaculum rubrum]|uniref:DUF5806 family protein n=1 Tax=Halobaculum rubrum TaxID=2872158 RepID=UPI001CA3C6AE|nr:DUF5806 family protein [Halobaculum rubrum]QZY00847.1 DUF5806 family protein [Halobaculum rubrum]
MTDDAGSEAGDADATAAGGADGSDGRTTDGGEGAGEEVVGAPPDNGADPADDSSGGDRSTEDASGSVPGPDVGADEADGDATGDAADDGPESSDSGAPRDVPDDVAKYDRFQKMERAEYDRVNEFLRDRTYVTAREWAIARLCADFRTETGVEMTKIGENLPQLVPFMTDTYTPQAVNQARASFEEKVRKAGATFLYGAMSGFFTAEDLDDVMYESTEVAKFLLEVEGADLTVEEELAAEDKISSVMRDVREASAEVRGEEVKCPECGHVHEP